MENTIRYGGYSTTPSDRDCPDGQLAASVNLISEDGALHPLHEPQTLFTLPSGFRVMFVHATATFKHYIVLDEETNRLYWLSQEDAHGKVIAYFASNRDYKEGEIVRYIKPILQTELNIEFLVDYTHGDGVVLDGDNKNAEEVPERMGTTYEILNLVYNFGDATVYEVKAIGNTLCVLCSDGLHYILWRPDDSRYTYLGQKPPMVELSFGLSEEKKAAYDMIDNLHTQHSPETYSSAWKKLEHTENNYFVPQPGVYADCEKIKIYDDKINEINNAIYALVNKTNSLISKEGHFYAPFFVRYCYRMYDGEMWMHSAPVFMPVAVPNSYQVELTRLYTQDNQYVKLEDSTGDADVDANVNDEDFGDINLTNFPCIRYRPHNVALEFKCISGSISDLKNNWGDIIKSIDIFVSLPIIREDVNEKIKTASVANLSYNLTHKTINDDDVPGVLCNKPYTLLTNSGEARFHEITFDIPLFSEEFYLDKIHSVDNFYKVASYNLETDVLPTSDYEEVKINGTALSVLATQEVMTDDYKSHNNLLPIMDGDGNSVTKLFTNNKRLYVTAPKERLFSGYHAGAFVPYCQMSLASYTGPNTLKVFNVNKIITYLRTEEGEKRVVWENNTGFELSSVVLEQCPLFYPDNRASRIEVYATSSSKYYKLEFDMEVCAIINGATTKGGIFVNPSDMTSTRTENDSVFPEVDENPFFSYNYKLYSSEVDNPFIFHTTGINSVGSGTINAIATVNEPVSTGQFGYSNIYIFTTDGLWVAKINPDGSLHDINPVSQDVCTNPAAVVQLAKTVLFPTQRGIMAVAGSRIESLTDTIDTDNPFDLSTLPHLTDVMPAALGTLALPAFQQFIDGCKMLYDYQHQRVVVFNPAVDTNDQPLYPYAYVYSLRSNLWGMMQSGLTDTFNAYPDAMAMSGNTVVTLNTDTTFGNQMFVTRPLKLGLPDVLKTIRAIIQRGMFARGHVKCILYGSRDLYSWHLVSSSTTEAIRSLRGTPYKYFRVAAVATLSEGESLSGVTVDMEPRHTSVIL